MKTGDGFACTAMLVWLMVSVGPWWVGVAIILGGVLLNYLTDRKPHA